ncbi:MAG: hypothetical protein PHT40_04180 [Patescibacteria group bacterium]|nr:hypothetical protein [Patescibacteria group bacterium]
MKRTSITSVQVTPGQKNQFERLVADAARHGANLALAKVKADRIGWQNLLSRGDELRTAIAELVVAETRGLVLSKRYAGEEKESDYGYLSGYKKPMGLTDQINLLCELFSGLGYPNPDLQKQIENGAVKLPEYAEGWFAIPNWVKNPQIFGTTYSAALQKILDQIDDELKRIGFNENCLHQSAHSISFWRNLSKAQDNPDILIIAAQFGIRHRGRSSRRALEVIMSTPGEYALGAFAVSCMLLTHPERLKDYDDLWIDCPGDEYNYPGFKTRFGRVLFFSFLDKKIRLDGEGNMRVATAYGSASAFLAQQI